LLPLPNTFAMRFFRSTSAKRIAQSSRARTRVSVINSRIAVNELAAMVLPVARLCEHRALW
jgi:hypothetical protein